LVDFDIVPPRAKGYIGEFVSPGGILPNPQNPVNPDSEPGFIGLCKN
jgi:hypothetical protein